jgi:hypothetical protein
MVRLYLETLAHAVAVALSIGFVIAFCAIGCMMNQRDHYTSHNVKGFRAPVVSHLSSNN